MRVRVRVRVCVHVRVRVRVRVHVLGAVSLTHKDFLFFSLL